MQKAGLHVATLTNHRKFGRRLMERRLRYQERTVKHQPIGFTNMPEDVDASNGPFSIRSSCAVSEKRLRSILWPHVSSGK
jgi:hypothetical protein